MADVDRVGVLVLVRSGTREAACRQVGAAAVFAGSGLVASGGRPIEAAAQMRRIWRRDLRAAGVLLAAVASCTTQTRGAPEGAGAVAERSVEQSRPPMAVVEVRVDHCDALELWVPDIRCAELVGKVSRVRVAMRTSDSMARLSSAAMRVAADGQVVHVKGNVPPWSPDLGTGSDVVMAGIVEIAEPYGSALARVWSLSGPPKALRGSLVVENGGFHARLELVTRTPDDAVKVTKLIEHLRTTDVVLQALGVGDFAPVIRAANVSYRGSVAVAALAIARDEASALVTRVKLMDWPGLPDAKIQAFGLYLDADGTFSSSGWYAPLARLEELVRTVPEQVHAILIEYPPGTSHQTISEVFASIRQAGRHPWVATQARPSPRVPALVAFDAKVRPSMASKIRSLLQGCAGGSADSCWELGTILESEPDTGGPQRAYAYGCRLGHRHACDRAGRSPH